MSHPVRRVAMRDGLMMMGNHHMPPGKRHWRADASSFCLVDNYGAPVVWIEGNEVVGEMAITIAKPQLLKGAPDVGSNETLLRFEVVKIGTGRVPMILTWWARGKNVDQTQRVARLEVIDFKTWPERMKQLMQLMGCLNA